MGKILLDFTFPITVIEPIPAASTAFLKQACVVAKPKAGQEGNVGDIFECTSMTQVAVRTDNENAEQLFNAGMNRVFVLLADDLDLAAPLLDGIGRFFTVLISDDFDDDDLDEVTVPAVAAAIKIQDITYTAKTAGTAGNSITVSYLDTNTGGAASATATGSAIAVSIEAGVTPASAIAAAIVADSASNALVTAVVDTGDESDSQDVTGSPISLTGGAAATTTPGSLDVGTFDGVVGFSSDDAEVCQLFGATANRCGFFRGETNGAENMFFAFGSLLANQSSWLNQQYITMPEDDGVDDLGEAESLFDDRVSFVLTDDEFGNRLSFFVAGGKAIVAPYISKNIRIDIQSRTLSWIAANQPDYTLVNAALLEQRINEDVIEQKYIVPRLITAGTIEVKLINDNFAASGFINIAEPKALWRVIGEMRQTL